MRQLILPPPAASKATALPRCRPPAAVPNRSHAAKLHARQRRGKPSTRLRARAPAGPRCRDEAPGLLHREAEKGPRGRPAGRYALGEPRGEGLCV